MTTAPSLQAVAGRATADARIPPSCPLIGGASREAVKRWAGASRDALLLTLALARWLAACRGGAHQRRHRRIAASRGADYAPRQDEEKLTDWLIPLPHPWLCDSTTHSLKTERVYVDHTLHW